MCYFLANASFGKSTIMSKKIVINTITDSAISTLSKWNVANERIKALDKAFKESKAKIEKKIASAIENRENDMANGISLDDVTRKYPVDGFYAEIKKLEDKHRKNVKPHKDNQKSCYELLGLGTEGMYASYVLAFENKDSKAVGTVTVNKGKKSEKIVSVNQSFTERMRIALTDMGINAVNDTALEKFNKDMLYILSGGVADKKGNMFVVERGENAFNDMFIRAFLRIAVVDKKVLEVAEDNTINRREWNDDNAVYPTPATADEVAKALEDSKKAKKVSVEETRATRNTKVNK